MSRVGNDKSSDPEFPFTAEYKERITEVLKKSHNPNFSDPNRIENFITKLGFFWEGAACLLCQPGIKTYQKDKTKTLDILHKIGDKKEEKLTFS